MSQPPVTSEVSKSARSPVAAHPVLSAAIAILIIASIVGTLVVPIYASATPKIGDFPFFYFYMLIYMPAVCVALLIVIALQNRLRSPADTDGVPANVTGGTK
jgi:hypothetical protein